MGRYVSGLNPKVSLRPEEVLNEFDSSYYTSMNIRVFIFLSQKCFLSDKNVS